MARSLPPEERRRIARLRDQSQGRKVLSFPPERSHSIYEAISIAIRRRDERKTIIGIAIAVACVATATWLLGRPTGLEMGGGFFSRLLYQLLPPV